MKIESFRNDPFPVEHNWLRNVCQDSRGQGVNKNKDHSMGLRRLI